MTIVKINGKILLYHIKYYFSLIFVKIWRNFSSIFILSLCLLVFDSSCSFFWISFFLKIPHMFSFDDSFLLRLSFKTRFSVDESTKKIFIKVRIHNRFSDLSMFLSHVWFDVIRETKIYWGLKNNYEFGPKYLNKI